MRLGILFLLFLSCGAFGDVAESNIFDIPAGKLYKVPCGGAWVELAVQANMVNVWGKADFRPFKFAKVVGFDADRSNRTLIFEGNDGWKIYFVDSVGVAPGLVRLAVVKVVPRVAATSAVSESPVRGNNFVSRPTPFPTPRW